ncbi:MAG TPA: hypothetical protein VI197_32685, partial [Polyangiaceae bacterium]
QLVLAVLLLASFGIAGLGFLGLESALASVAIDSVALLALSMLGVKFGLDLKLGAIPPPIAWLVWGLTVGAGGLMSAQLGALAASASLPLSAMAALFAQ